MPLPYRLHFEMVGLGELCERQFLNSITIMIMITIIFQPSSFILHPLSFILHPFPPPPLGYRPNTMHFRKIVLTLSAVLVILAGGGAFGLILVLTGPETIPQEKQESATIVHTIPLSPQDKKVWVTAYGEVIPARKVEMQPQVSGQVIWQNAAVIPGGRLRENEELIRIDPKDYELDLSLVKAEFEQARFEREVESGRQVIARREWNELQQDLDAAEVNESLVLREPHFRRAEALMEEARNDIEQAELQLSRTTIRAPFNAMVVEESVEVGQLLSIGSSICALVGTDEFWIQVTVPLSMLKWIQFPDGDLPGAEATIVLDTGNGSRSTWQGKVLRLLSDLEPLGRMARVVVTVPDPLGIEGGAKDSLPLLLGSYVEVNIEAGELENVLEIPRAAMREGNKIWVVGSVPELKIMDCEVLWTLKETVLVSNNLDPGEALIVSDMRVALPGMLVTPQPSHSLSGIGQ